MTPERWQRVEELYHAALARGVADRAAFLANACAGDEALRREVESLLAQPASGHGFLDGPAVAMAAELVSDSDASVLSGRRLGAHQVHARIGWLARREREAVASLIEENRCLRRQLGTRRVRLTDDDRRRLATDFSQDLTAVGRGTAARPFPRNELPVPPQ